MGISKINSVIIKMVSNQHMQGVQLIKEPHQRITKSDNHINNDPQNNTRIIFDGNYKLTLKPVYTIVN